MPDGRQPGTLRVRVLARAQHLRQARQLARRLRRFMAALRLRDAEVSLRLAGDATLRRLNREQLGKDRTTDVLSFPAAAVPGSALLGVLVISVPVAKRWAARLERPLSDELALYAAHGLLHLLGHRHGTAAERARMQALERKLLGEDGLIGRTR